MAYKMSIDEAIEVLNDVVRYPDDFTEIQIDAVKIGLKSIQDMMKFVVANAELAKLNATLIEFVSEVNYTPYSDSNYLSLLESLRSRASAILQDIASAQNIVSPTRRNMHHVLESSVGVKCTCGKPASHKVEEVLDFDSLPLIEDDILAATRHPLTVYLCCQCFSKLMGDPFDWCGLTKRAPDEATGCAHRAVRPAGSDRVICDDCGKTLRR